MYQALYRKWRPVTFDDVIGQEHITTTLKNQVSSGKPSHAYLFTGSRGTGKTSCSKILAKAVNCPNQTDGNPCGVCNICKGIDNESILDVTEIDAASNSGVDNIRDLREEANFTPVVTKYRVYIIDETHMLSTGAFNALLKIMEEPPPHVIFVLATTEIHKVPATILSRCQRFDFNRIPSKTIGDQLMYIASEEDLSLTDDGAMLIARLSDGSMRDGLSLLDLCRSFEGEINENTVRAIAGLSDDSYIFNMGEIIANNDFTGALELLNDLWAKSVDPEQFCHQLLGFYRNLLIVKSATKPEEILDIAPSEMEGLKGLKESYSVSRIFYSISTLSDTLERVAKTSQKRGELEIGLLKLCDMSTNTSNDALVARIEKLELKLKHPPVVQQAAPTTQQTATAQGEQPQATIAQPQSVAKEESPPVQESAPDKAQPSQDEFSGEGAVPFEQWQDVLEILQTINPAIHASLISSSAYFWEGYLLIDAGSELFTNLIRTDEYAKESIREATQRVTGIVYNLGPFDPDKYKVKKKDNNLFDDIIDSARELGVNTEIQD